MTLVAGVDSSTQSCTIAVVDIDSGTTVRSGHAAHPSGSEINPAVWWTALEAAITDAGGFSDVSAVSIAGQQHGMVALDADGHVIRDALLWNDTRSAGAARDLVAEVGAEEYARRTGVVPVASFTATKLRWLRDHEPDNAARVHAVALPHDWLTWRLRGFGSADDSAHGPNFDELITDRSEASGTAYWSQITGDYDRELLSRALGHDAVLPRILGPDRPAGSGITYCDTNLPGVVVGPGAGDNAGGVLGLEASSGDAVVSIGTSGTVCAVTTRIFQDPSGTVASFADAAGTNLSLVATLNAARVLDTVAHLLDVSHAVLSDLALAASPGSGGLVLTPYFEGERTPNLPDAKASLTGMTLGSTTRENLARAAVEGMLCALAYGLDAVRSQGTPVARVLLIGGAARSPAVQEVASTVFDVPVDVPEQAEHVARGAAVQAAWCLTGSRPKWEVPLAASRAAAPVTAVRDQYDAAIGQGLPDGATSSEAASR